MAVRLFPSVEQSEVGDALSHKLEVAKRRSRASYYPLTTGGVNFRGNYLENVRVRKCLKVVRGNCSGGGR